MTQIFFESLKLECLLCNLSDAIHLCEITGLITSSDCCCFVTKSI